VTSELPQNLGEFFLDWIDGHARDVLACPGFTGAHVYEAESGREGMRVFVVQYTLTSREALEEYVLTHAPRLRADGARAFGDALRATRRVMQGVKGITL